MAITIQSTTTNKSTTSGSKNQILKFFVLVILISIIGWLYLYRFVDQEQQLFGSYNNYSTEKEDHSFLPTTITTTTRSRSNTNNNNNNNNDEPVISSNNNKKNNDDDEGNNVNNYSRKINNNNEKPPPPLQKTTTTTTTETKIMVQQKVDDDDNEEDKTTIPTTTVNHAFIKTSSHGEFIVIDRYIVERRRRPTNDNDNDNKSSSTTTNTNNTMTIAVLADGLAPIQFDEKDGNKIDAKFICTMNGQQSKEVQIQLMRSEQPANVNYILKYGGQRSGNPFSGNGDKFRTMIIFCIDLPVPTNYYNDYDDDDDDDENKKKESAVVPPPPPLILSSIDGETTYNGTFNISIDTPFVIPDHLKRKQKPSSSSSLTTQHQQKQKQQLTAVHCVCPIYNTKSSHWMIEYIEYHLSIGVSHLHIYDFDYHWTPIMDVYKEYQRLGVITYHDWSKKSSSHYTGQSYEHGKWAASTDCLLRSRGYYDYALFSDIDELWMSGSSSIDTTSTTGIAAGHISYGLNECHKAHIESNGVVVGCGVHSHTMTSVYTNFTLEEQKSTLLLERYDREEAEPTCPNGVRIGNCHCRKYEPDPKNPSKKTCVDLNRMYHIGRAKLIVYIGDLSIDPRPIFTHGISRNYNELDKIQYQLPDSFLHVRHYQGHWLKHLDLLSDTKLPQEKYTPIPTEILNKIRNNIQQSKVIGPIYNSKVATGVDWIIPVLGTRNRLGNIAPAVGVGAGAGAPGLNNINSSNQQLQQPTKNKDIAAATATATNGSQQKKLYLTYQRTGGRVNNQWYQLVAALTVATRLNRTLLVPPERAHYEITRMFQPQLGYWDLDWLYGNYSLEYVDDPNDGRLNVTDKSCQGGYKKLAEEKVTIIQERYQHCPILFMPGGEMPECQKHQVCGGKDQQRLSYEIYNHFRPGPQVKKYLPDDLHTYKYSVHSRTPGGAAVDSGNPEICGPLVLKSATSHFDPKNKKNFTKYIDGNCFLNETLVEALGSEKFLLASDGTWDWKTHYGDRAVIVSELLGSNFPKYRGRPEGILASLIELWSIAKAKDSYFFGNVYSTFSTSICNLRGEELKYQSNICWISMHPDTEYAVPPPEETERTG